MEVNDLRKIMLQKMKAREDTSLVKYVIAECERFNKSPINVLEKLKEDNQENFRLSGNEKFLKENEEIDSYLPKYVSVSDLVVLLEPTGLDNNGKSIGLAIKHLEQLKIPFKKQDVKTALDTLASTKLVKG